MKNFILGVSYTVSLASVFAVGAAFGGLWVYGQVIEALEDGTLSAKDWQHRKPYHEFRAKGED